MAAATVSFRRAFVLAYATLWALTLGVAALVLVAPSGPVFARGVLRLSLSGAHNPAPGFGGVLSIALNNILHSVWPLLLGSIGAQRRRLTRLLADGAVLANLLLAALLVGGAFGGYGVRVLAFLPHVPLEWAGIAVGAAGWVVQRRRKAGWPERRSAVALAVVLLGWAAVIESSLVPMR